MSIERISIELTNQCSKQCNFCYNRSNPKGKTAWVADEIVTLIKDCADRGTKAVSFGGGEPLEYPELFDVLTRLQGVLFRSVTSNGLLLRGRWLDGLIKSAPDKVHLSLHFPENEQEVFRIIRQVHQLNNCGIRSGVNILVSKSKLQEASQAALTIRRAGIGNDRIVYLPMRGSDTPTPQEIAKVAGDRPFQSMSCLASCGCSSRFCAISWDKKVAWCSYTNARRPLKTPTAEALEEALYDLPLAFCGS